ncbi:hypothetical protein BDN70DRAFT_939942 [Pholiota conissans]|uniref:Uncharacterized protein n=1 Tax=Pholiota conissans TaxID=109636 RepID=A0A9P5YMA8_9AGAR|nr:hypothetical protein BDN70DRAFT_939942 [Pholiota conissans]
MRPDCCPCIPTGRLRRRSSCTRVVTAVCRAYVVVAPRLELRELQRQEQMRRRACALPRCDDVAAHGPSAAAARGEGRKGVGRLRGQLATAGPCALPRHHDVAAPIDPPSQLRVGRRWTKGRGAGARSRGDGRQRRRCSAVRWAHGVGVLWGRAGAVSGVQGGGRRRAPGGSPAPGSPLCSYSPSYDIPAHIAVESGGAKASCARGADVVVEVEPCKSKLGWLMALRRLPKCHQPRSNMVETCLLTTTTPRNTTTSPPLSTGMGDPGAGDPQGAPTAPTARYPADHVRSTPQHTDAVSLPHHTAAAVACRTPLPAPLTATDPRAVATARPWALPRRDDVAACTGPLSPTIPAATPLLSPIHLAQLQRRGPAVTNRPHRPPLPSGSRSCGEGPSPLSPPISAHLPPTWPRRCPTTNDDEGTRRQPATTQAPGGDAGTATRAVDASGRPVWRVPA